MQPKRDPNDRRYWPISHGGTGDGFTGKDRTTHPRRYNAIAKARERRTMTLPSIDAVRESKTPEAVRMRARLILDMALDALQDKLSTEEHTLQVLSSTVTALGKIAGVASMEVEHSHRMLPVEERDRALARLTAKATLANPLTVANLATVEDANVQDLDTPL